MTNEIISVPEWNNNTINYIISVKVFINNSHRETLTAPPIFDKKTSRRLKNDISKRFSKYIYKNKHQDTLKHFKKLFSSNRELKFNRFVTENVDNIDIIKHHDYHTLRFVVKYLEVREPIVSYIEQKLGQCLALDELKQSFCQKNQVGYDEYLTQKSNYLLNLDLDNFVDELNKDTLKKDLNS